MTLRLWWLIAAGAGLACGDPHDREPAQPAPEAWAVGGEKEGAALLSVSGAAPADVWLVGADDGTAPLVLPGNGVDWQREHPGVRADLWWVQALPNGSVYMGGSAGTVLEYRAGA